MNENCFHVTVEDSVFCGKSPGLHRAILFSACYLVQFFVYIILDMSTTLFIENGNAVFLFMLIDSTIITALFYEIKEKKTKGVMKISVTMTDDYMELTAKKKKWIIYYKDITEIRKQMMITPRTYEEKGHYKLKIIMRHKPALVFESTGEEYEKRSDFEETELYTLYKACKKQGIKCC